MIDDGPRKNNRPGKKGIAVGAATTNSQDRNNCLDNWNGNYGFDIRYNNCQGSS